MADIMALQARLEAVKAARDLGAVRVTFEGRTTEYRSLDDMDRIIKDLEGQIEGEMPGSTATTVIRQIRIQTSKGV